ncbi:MAG: hypothetical protein LC700_01265, partial [Actinobacteria bacterium]|nr:hypothetical protein [Actinomycetota bacterium]
NTQPVLSWPALYATWEEDNRTNGDHEILIRNLGQCGSWEPNHMHSIVRKRNEISYLFGAGLMV